jgi:PAS domain S-box-containing protein
MLAYWDRGLTCRFANRAFERWFGVDPQSLVGTALVDLLGPSLFKLNEPYIQGVLNGTKQVFEREVPGRDGSVRHSLATYVPDVVDGEVTGFIAHVTEVTQLKETEAALRAEAAQREGAMEALSESKAALVEAQRLGGVGNWEWTVESDVTVWSDGLYRIFGRDPRQAPPTYAEHPSLYSADSWERLQDAVATCLRTGEPYTLELEYLRVDGLAGWLEARGEAIRSASGAITRLRGTVHEVTLRRRMEDVRVKARGAEAASQNKSQLLSRVSHELRTPLNAIIGFAYLIEKDASLGPKHRRWGETIAGAGRHMLDLVNDVLDMSAAEAGRITMKRVAVEPLAILQECLLHVSSAATAGGITLSGIEAASPVVHVQGDPKRLTQVFNNLLSNAIKYTPAGGRVRVDLTELDHSVEIAIHDTGVGLSSEQLERMFRPFERLGAEATTVPGTGLGLALSKTLVELLGGSLRVNSQVGTGSTFTVSLPKTSRA